MHSLARISTLRLDAPRRPCIKGDPHAKMTPLSLATSRPIPHSAVICLQVLPQASGQPAATFVSIALDLLRKEGVPALWHGLGARLLTIGPGAALSWTIYEEVHRRLRARR